MIHVVFNEPDVEVIAKAIELDETLSGPVMLIRDDYAVGPLENLFTPEGAAVRKDWWRMVLEHGDLSTAVEEGLVNDEQVVEDMKEALTIDENQVLWIWAAQNKHDVCGYYWLMSQLAEFQGRVFILYLNNLPFINEKGNIFYPDWLSQIPPKEFIKAKKLSRPITSSEFEVDPDEWTKICNEGKMVRLLEGGKKLVQKDEDYYDAELVKYITSDAQKAHKIIHLCLTKSKDTTGDAYLLWRLKKITATDEYEVAGELKGLKDFEIKKRSAVQAGE